MDSHDRTTVDQLRPNEHRLLSRRTLVTSRNERLSNLDLHLRTDRAEIVAFWALLLSCAMAMPACSDNCPGDYHPPSYKIRVLDASANTEICDATVRVDNAVARTLEDCTYYAEISKAPPEQARLVVEHEGFSPVEEELAKAYDVDHCGKALPVQVTVRMERER